MPVSNPGLPLPTAACVQAFLRQALGNAGDKWLMPVISFCENIPALSGNILEMHFDKKENNVDFATRLNVTYDKALIDGFGQHNYSLPFLPGNFTSLIQANESAFNHGIENIWIEYDAPFVTPPSLFFDVKRNKPFRPRVAYNALQQIADHLEHPVSKPVLPFLERVKETGLHVVYYGLMFSRKAASVRLTIHGITVENLSAALKDLEWRGNYEALKNIEALYLHKEQKLVVGVDFSNHLENRIGIEVFDDNQNDFIQKLFGNRHINRTQFETLNTWPQTVALPTHLANSLTELHQRPVTKLHTRINHFKFVLDDSETIKTKGYLYYCF